ncbi:MAG TPA: tetratricopeptide repeat protein [Nitrospirales bacterium]
MPHKVSKILKEARGLAAEGKVDRAIAECRQTLAQHPDESQIYLCLGDLSLQHQLMPEASEAYSQAARLFLQEGGVVDAVSCYKHIVKIEPHRADVCVLLGDANAGRGQLNNAVADYLAGAKLYAQSGAIMEAIGVFRKVLLLTPQNLSARLRIAELSLAQGETAEAIEQYQHVAVEYKAHQRDVEAQALYELILKHSPDHAGDTSQRVPISPAIGMLETIENQNASNETNQIVVDRDESLAAPIHPANGTVHDEIVVESLADLEMMILDEGKVEPSVVEEGPFEIEETEEILESSSGGSTSLKLQDEFEARYEIALAYKEMGLLDEAIESFEQALRGPNRFLDSCTMIATCYKDRGLNRAAIEWLQRAVSHPQCEGALALSVKFALAQLYEIEGDVEQAAHLYGGIPGMRRAADRLAAAQSRSDEQGSAGAETAAPS